MREKITAVLVAIALVTSVTFVGLVGPAAATTGHNVDIMSTDAQVSNTTGDTLSGSEVMVWVGNDGTVTDANVTVVNNATGTTYADEEPEFDDDYIAGIPTADIGSVVGDSTIVDILIDGQLHEQRMVEIVEATVTEVPDTLSDDLSGASSIEVTYRTADLSSGDIFIDDWGTDRYETELGFGNQIWAAEEINTSGAGDTITVDFATATGFNDLEYLPTGETDTLYFADAAAVVTVDGTEIYNDANLASDHTTTTIDAPEIVDVGDATVPITVTTTGTDVSDGTITAADVGLEDGTGTTFTETTSDVTDDTLTVEYDVDTSAIGSAIGDTSMFYATVGGTTEASTTVELTDLTEWDVTIDPEYQTLNITGYSTDVDVDVWGNGKDHVDLDALEIDGTSANKLLNEDPDYPGVTWLFDSDNVGTQAGDSTIYTVSYHGYDLGTFEIELVDSSTTDSTTTDSTTTDTTTNTTSNYTVDVTYPAEIDDTDDVANVTIAVNGTAVEDGTITATDIALEANGTAYNATNTNTTAIDEIVIDYSVNATDVGTVDGDTLALDVVVGGTVEQTISIMFVEPVLGTSSGSTSSGLIILLGLLAVAGGGMLLARD